MIHFPGHIIEQIIAVVIALLIVGLCLFIFVRAYWTWHLNHPLGQGFGTPNRKPTLFDVRELLLRGEKEMAVRIYRQIFKTEQKAAQAAIDDLEKSLHQHGG